MKKKAILAFILILLAVTPFFGARMFKIGTVDVEEVFASYPGVDDVRKKLKDEREAFQGEIDKRKEEIARLEKDYQSADKLSDAEKDRREAEISYKKDLLAESGAGVVHCPESNMKLASGGVMPLAELRTAGVKIALGTDGGCTNNRLSIFEEMRMAALLQKVTHLDGTAFRAEDAFVLGTVGGGGMEQRTSEEAKVVARSGQSKIVEYNLVDPQQGDPGVCGGTVEIFIEPINPPPAVIIIGAINNTGGSRRAILINSGSMLRPKAIHSPIASGNPQGNQNTPGRLPSAAASTTICTFTNCGVCESRTALPGCCFSKHIFQKPMLYLRR